MWKLLTLLAMGMFLTMLIGGQDFGQVREGLLPVPDQSPAVTTAAFDPGKIEPEDAPPPQAPPPAV